MMTNIILNVIRVIQILMSKLFIRLISELKSLGCKIIYADYYRVIIATTRFVSNS